MTRTPLPASAPQIEEAGCIFQHCNAFHILRVDIVDIAVIGEIVDDDQRLGLARIVLRPGWRSRMN